MQFFICQRAVSHNAQRADRIVEELRYHPGRSGDFSSHRELHTRVAEFDFSAHLYEKTRGQREFRDRRLVVSVHEERIARDNDGVRAYGAIGRLGSIGYWLCRKRLVVHFRLPRQQAKGGLIFFKNLLRDRNNCFSLDHCFICKNFLS